MRYDVSQHAKQGGKATVKKYGSKHMIKIGKRGRKKQLKALLVKK